MDIFISWSGTKSKKIAESFRKWLPSVIQAVRPYYTPEDIAKGDRWSGEIAKKLETSQIGILLVTKENLSAPWLMFEAGALSKNLGRSKVCPIIFDIKPTDIEGPLLQFQCAEFNESEIKKLLHSINESLGESKLSEVTLADAFELWWPKLVRQIEEILHDANNKESVVKQELRTDRQLLEELLRLARKYSYRSYRDGSLDGGSSLLSGKRLVTFDADTETFEFWDGNFSVYDFGLERLSNSAEILDWIFQVNQKGWCTPQHLKSFVETIEEVSDMYFGVNAQGICCPMGAYKKIVWSKK